MAIPFFPYKLFFLYIEPIAAISGACYAGLRPNAYIADLVPNSSTSYSVLPAQVLMTLYQLSNLYLLIGLNMYFVLSSTDDVKTWKRFLFGLLVADFGHIISVSPLGLDIYWKIWEWNTMLWGSIGFSCLGAATRLAFLFGIGLSQQAVGSPERAKKT